MSFPLRRRNLLCLQVACWWLLIVARAGAQIDLTTGSVLDAGLPLTAPPAASPAATFATQFPDSLPTPPPTSGNGSNDYLTIPASDPEAVVYAIGGQAR